MVIFLFLWFGQLFAVLQTLKRSSFGKFVRTLGNCFQRKGDVAHPAGTSSGQVRQFQNSSSALMSLFQGFLDIVLPSAGKLLGHTCNSV